MTANPDEGRTETSGLPKDQMDQLGKTLADFCTITGKEILPTADQLSPEERMKRKIYEDSREQAIDRLKSHRKQWGDEVGSAIEEECSKRNMEHGLLLLYQHKEEDRRLYNEIMQEEQAKRRRMDRDGSQSQQEPMDWQEEQNKRRNGRISQRRIDREERRGSGADPIASGSQQGRWVWVTNKNHKKKTRKRKSTKSFMCRVCGERYLSFNILKEHRLACPYIYNTDEE